MICHRIFSILGLVMFLLKFLLKSAPKSFFFALAPRSSGLGGTISHAIARISMVCCDSIFRYRSVMAALRLLGAAAACVILLCFAAGHRKSYWSGCIKASFVVQRSTGKCFVQPL